MKIGLRDSPHLEAVKQGIEACGDRLVQHWQPCDWYLAWGWPSAQQIQRDINCDPARIICVDSHPFALMAGDTSGARILQLGNFGALAKYPDVEPIPIKTPVSKHDPDGPVLVVGQVYTDFQRRAGLVDVWHTGGFEDWLASELAKPNRRLREHPRVWIYRQSQDETVPRQPTLIEDLEGCSEVRTWNSTVGVHARLLGYPNVTASEAHGWAHMDLAHLNALRATPDLLRTGSYWHQYRSWLQAG